MFIILPIIIWICFDLYLSYRYVFCDKTIFTTAKDYLMFIEKQGYHKCNNFFCKKRKECCLSIFIVLLILKERVKK